MKKLFYVGAMSLLSFSINSQAGTLYIGNATGGQVVAGVQACYKLESLTGTEYRWSCSYSETGVPVARILNAAPSIPITFNSSPVYPAPAGYKWSLESPYVYIMPQFAAARIGKNLVRPEEMWLGGYDSPCGAALDSGQVISLQAYGQMLVCSNSSVTGTKKS